MFSKVYEVNLPDDYLHILNCVVEYKLLQNYRCYDAGSYWHQGATRLTADMYSQIINNFFLRPSYKRPYYYISNINTSNILPVSDNQVPIGGYYSKFTIDLSGGNPTAGSTIIIDGTTFTFKEIATGALDISLSGPKSVIECLYSAITKMEDPKLLDVTLNPDLQSAQITIIAKTDTITIVKDGAPITPVNTEISLIEKSSTIRYGNKSKVRMEIRYGTDDSVFKLNNVFIDYLKAPQFIRLTQDQVDSVADTTQILEFPDYVCQEIVNELIRLLMENASDPRIQTNPIINKSIADIQQQEPQQRKR